MSEDETPAEGRADESTAPGERPDESDPFEDAATTPRERVAELYSSSMENVRDAAGDASGRGGMDPMNVERLFSILDEAIGEESDLDDEEQSQLLSVLESAMVSPAPMGRKEVDQLFSILESVVVDPADSETVEEVLSVLTAAVPGGADVDVTDSDGFFSVLESAIANPTEPQSSIGGMFSLIDSASRTLTGRTTERDDVFSMFDPDHAESTAGDVMSLFDPTDPGQGRGEDVTDGGSRSDPFRIARIVAAATQRTTDYSIRSGIRTGTSLARAASTASSVEEFMDDARDIAFTEIERLGVDVGDGYGSRQSPYEDFSDDSGPADADVLQRHGQQLLEQSADIDYEMEIHPAFPRILDNLASDEARILRLLATEGPQPAVNVRDVGYVPIKSKLVAAGLSMIGSEAGLRYEKRTQTYLNNLERLGLIWFSDEPVADIKRYQVVEAQPAVDDAIEAARRAKMVRRSIHLTPFGADVCQVCFPFEVREDAAGAFEVPTDLSE
jgi:hypothetical protein